MKHISKERWKYIFKRNFVLLLTGLLPTTLGLICTQQGAKDLVKDILPKDTFPICYSHGWQLGVIIFVCIVIPIITNVIHDFYELNSNIKIINLYNGILSYIQDCVERKKSRFFEEIGKHSSPSTVFMHITKPEKQLDALCSGLCNLYKDYYDINDVKGAIIDCENNKMKQFIVVCGDDQPSLTIDDLNKNESLARHCMQCKTTYIVEDTDKESFFYKYNGCCIKSAICFPLKRGKDVAMLVFLTSKQKKSFINSKKNEYELIFKYFGSRMLLEDYLYDLKSSCQ